MLIHKQEFISKSRARVRHVKLRQEQRLIEQVPFNIKNKTDKQVINLQVHTQGRSLSFYFIRSQI